MIPAPEVDGRRVESFVSELRRFAPHYTPDLNLSDAQGAGVALIRIFAQLAETISVRLDQSPQKNFVAFLDRLGITLLPARAARVPVTFRLAAGLNEAATVPRGTRVTAPGEEDDIPFETTGSLVAIPGILAAAYGVHPSRDFIFQPPLNFLSQEPRTPSDLKYKILSFVPAGSNRLQLDHTSELEPGSFVLIGCKEKAVILKKDDGGFVTLLKGLDNSFPPDTVVVPIRDFEVFDGISIQEHVLYLGHDGIFNVKEKIEIKLNFELDGGSTTAGLSPLNLAWQYFTKDDTAIPEEEEHWEDLEIATDQTNGLSRSGEIVLRKQPDREIKALRISGTQSRWIRARVKDPLPVGGPPLPDVETIKVGVNTRLDLTKTRPEPIGIPADQGFYNATPLDVKVAPGIGFFPFGAEPRQFDQFYIASKEAFSKRDAQVTLDFEIDQQTLAAPSLISTNLGLRAYSIGLRRRLFELDVPAASFNILGSPESQGSSFLPDASSVPSAISDGADGVFAFVATTDSLSTDPASKVWVHFHKTNVATGTWTDIDAPDPTGKKLKFSPAAIATPTGVGWAHFSRVFVVGADDKLYSRGYTGGTTWDSHGSPGGTLDSSPFAIAVGAKIFVFISGGGNVHWLTLDAGLTATWKSLTPDSTKTFTTSYRPFAQSFGVPVVDKAMVFAFGFEDGDDKTTGKLFVTDTSLADSNGDFPWSDLDQPNNEEITDATPEAHAPIGFVENPNATFGKQGLHIFLRDANNRLYERIDDTAGGTPQWKDRTRPGDPGLRGSPAVYMEPASGVIPGSTTTRIHVLSASNRNSTVSWDFEEIKVNVPVAPDPTKRGVLLDSGLASTKNNEYPTKTLVVTDPSSVSRSATIDAYDGTRALLRLASQLNPVPDHNDRCSIAGTNLGHARDDADHLLTIHTPVNDSFAGSLLYLRIDDDFMPFEFYSRVTGVISMAPGNFPTFPAIFDLHSELVEGPTEYLSPEDTGTVPELSWEYWNGTGWLSLRKVSDETNDLLKSGRVSFPVPNTIEATEVAGQENFWIRARLVGGDYGHEIFKITGAPANQTVVSDKSSLRPPKVRELSISYIAAPVAPEVCFTFNNLNYLDQTAAAKTTGSHFPPFERLEEKSLTIFFGFDHTFKSGPVRLLLDAVERNIDETRPPEFEWFFRKDREWKKLEAEDGTVALTRQEMLTISASAELTRETRFGNPLFWIKGSFRTDRNLTEAEYPPPLLRGIFLNTVWATQGQTITDEIVGSGDGDENQIRSLQHADVLEGQDIRVQEPLSAEERERIQRQLGEDAVTDREDIGGTWVRWEEVKALFDRSPEDRCYEIDRASGTLKFGDGRHGSIPIAGVDNIRAFSYRTGGGLLGNVETNKIEALATAVEGIESAFNPTPAGGGSDMADTTEMLTIGPRQISHRDRAVSVEDFEELALEASRQVAKVRCLRSTNLVRSGIGKSDPCDPLQLHEALRQRGSVSLIIVPKSNDSRPCPSLALRREVKKYLNDRAPSIVAASERIVIRPPDYVIVGITADIFVTTLEKAADVESQALNRLNEFLHPVSGGPDGEGWEFGRPISKSDVFAVLERIADVDRVEKLEFHFRGKADPDRVAVGANELIACGEHKLSIKKAE